MSIWAVWLALDFAVPEGSRRGIVASAAQAHGRLRDLLLTIFASEGVKEQTPGRLHVVAGRLAAKFWTSVRSRAARSTKQSLREMLLVPIPPTMVRSSRLIPEAFRYFRIVICDVIRIVGLREGVLDAFGLMKTAIHYFC
jgi:hypothetical protein